MSSGDHGAPDHSLPIPTALARLAGHPGLILFDRGRAPGPATGHSILSCDPVDHLVYHPGLGHRPLDAQGQQVADPVAWLQQRLANAPEPAPAEGPAFVGGLAGLLGFELAWSLDALHHTARPTPHDPCPDLWVGDYPAAAALDHRSGRWTIHGDASSRAFCELEAALRAPATDEEIGALSRRDAHRRPPHWMIDPDQYQRQVARCLHAIETGELFEINFAERLVLDGWTEGAVALYNAMRQHSTGAHFGYLDTGDVQICSASPESFLSLRDGKLEAHPIKGSLGRHPDPAQDAALARALAQSEKDRAENVMIVDLMRNDLTRVCRPGSVVVERLCEIESFAGIHHMVSTVAGQLAPDIDPVTALLACFPPGSVTGAPKLRAVELIAALESGPRGPYTGTLFHCAPGRLEANVLIRTAWLHGQQIRYGAGGAVVADSTPANEWREAQLKARPLLAALGFDDDLL